MAEKKGDAPADLHPQAKVFVAKITDYQTVFQTEHGQRVLWDLISAHHVMGPTMPKNGDVNAMLIREGERNVVLRIFSLLKMDAAKVQKLIRESDNYVQNVHA
jgi:hypothetical protein